MKTYQILKETGARPETYFFTHLQLTTLPKILQKRLICRIHKIFTEYCPLENENYPNLEKSKFSKFNFEDLENALYDQAEKYLCSSQNFQTESKMIYNNKLNQNKIIEIYEKLNLGVILGFPQYIPFSLKDEILGFESRFECGNLQSAFVINKNEYELFLQTDFGNDKYTNWFFFRVYNTRKNNVYKFTVNNMAKAKSLFNEGMKITLFSEKLNKYFKTGDKIVYFCNFIKKKNNTNFYSLSFNLKFPENFDTVYIILNYPYTFSRVKSLTNFVMDNYPFVEKMTLCKTISGNDFNCFKIDYNEEEERNCDVIENGNLGNNNNILGVEKIENSENEENIKKTENDLNSETKKVENLQKPENVENLQKPEKVENLQKPENVENEVLKENLLKTKKIVIIGARVHPGETISSHIMENLLTTLLSQKCETTKNLLKKYIFYIIPMINIDGVISGNYRVNLSGFDLNRTYHDPSENLHPTIYHYKNFIKNLKNTKKEIYLFLDIHCHSKKFNTFIYSNPPLYGESNIFVQQMLKFVDFYSKKDTLFTIKKEKEKSARVVVWKEFGVEHSYTLEMSYAGIMLGKFKGIHHCLDSMKELGGGILKALEGLEEGEREQVEKRKRFMDVGLGEVYEDVKEL